MRSPPGEAGSGGTMDPPGPALIAESVFMFDDAETPRAAIYQAVGAASVCWESMAGTGVFDDRRACDVAESLIQRLADFGLHIDGGDHAS